MDIEDIRVLKEEAEYDISTYVQARLKDLSKATGSPVMGLELKFLQHFEGHLHKPTGSVLTDVSIDMGRI